MKNTTIVSVEDLQTVKRTRNLTIKKLQQKQDDLQKLARDHALATAIEYYETGSDYLKAVVFENWLEQHAFEEKFQPLNMVAR